MGHVRSVEGVASTLAASDAGVPDAEDARLHGVAVETISVSTRAGVTRLDERLGRKA